MVEHFAPIYTRSIGGEYRWCSRWWDHAEAIERLEALWRAWETLRLDPALGMAVWYRDHVDHHLPLLLSVAAPLAGARLSDTKRTGLFPSRVGRVSSEGTRPMRVARERASCNRARLGAVGHVR